MDARLGTEPEPVPVPTIGWLTWRIGWWWGTAADRAHGRPHMTAWVNAELMKNVAEIGQLRLQRAVSAH